MFEHDDNKFDFGRTQEIENDPVERLMRQPEETAQSVSGSYYSPRSGESGGGYIPPTGGYSDGSEPPKKKPHKGLKALALFAGVAFVAYASIQCYQYATENPSIRSFLGRQNSAVSEDADARPDSDADSSAKENADSSDTSSSKAEPMSFFELTARKDAMTIPEIVKKVTPATVGVSSTFLLEGRQQMTYDPFSFFGFGFGTQQQQAPDRELTGTGTGIIMRDNKDGSYYIITNAHVIYDSSEEYNMGLAKKVQVVLNSDCYPNASESGIEAEVKGYDVAEDIAVLKVKTDEKLTVAEFGDSNDLEVGEFVVAIGNPLGFELFGSVTTGIVSALDREVTINDQSMRLIQTDTAINAGNSGGPLINCYGQVIGINSSKISSNYYSNEASVEGLCFAIPMTHAQKVINDLINYGYVTGPQIGITQAEDVDESIAQRFGLPVGVYVKGIEKGSAADRAGLQVGDIITAIDDVTVKDTKELAAEKDKHDAGDTVTLTVIRQGEELEIPVTLTMNAPAGGAAEQAADQEETEN